jgi:hypothetical protein
MQWFEGTREARDIRGLRVETEIDILRDVGHAQRDRGETADEHDVHPLIHQSLEQRRQRHAHAGISGASSMLRA